MIDQVFTSWRDAGFVWLPEKGIGFYPVREEDAPYDAHYWEKYEGYADTPVGQALNNVRLSLLEKYARCGSVVDIGIGCGAFLSALRTAGRTNAFGFDINPVGEKWLRDRGWLLDPWSHDVDCVTFWDVLEHIKNPAPLLARVRRTVLVSLPIVPGSGPPPLNWKHLRRDEHCWYWTREGFIAWMAEHGFQCAEHNTSESLAGREDIGTFVFQRRPK